MIRLVEVFCATQRHQKTKNKKNESQTKVRMAYNRQYFGAQKAKNGDRGTIVYSAALTLFICRYSGLLS